MGNFSGVKEFAWTAWAAGLTLLVLTFGCSTTVEEKHAAPGVGVRGAAPACRHRVFRRRRL
jgi:hypothetical protein